MTDRWVKTFIEIGKRSSRAGLKKEGGEAEFKR